MKSGLYISFMDCDVGAYKKSLPNLKSQRLFSVFFYQFYSFRFYIQSNFQSITSLCYFCVWFKIEIKAFFFLDINFLMYFQMLTFSGPFTEEHILSPLYCLCTFVKNQCILYVQVCFRTLYFIPLIYLSKFMATSYCLEITQSNLSNFVLFFQSCLS